MHIMKAYGEVVIYLHSFLNSKPGGGVVSLSPWLIYPLLSVQFDFMDGRFQTHSERAGEDRIFILSSGMFSKLMHEQFNTEIGSTYSYSKTCVCVCFF